MVKLFNEYYRAILTDSKYNSRDRYELIDYGYVLPVKNENIRRLPDNLLFPCITLKCFLDGKFNRLKRDKCEIDISVSTNKFVCIFSVVTSEHQDVKAYRKRSEARANEVSTI